MPFNETDLAKYSRTKIALFIFDPILHRLTSLVLEHHGFEAVANNQVPHDYFQALGLLIPIIAGESELVLLNLPPKPRPETEQGEAAPIYDQIAEVYQDIKTRLAKKASDPLGLLSKTVPLIEVGDYLREKLVGVLFKYRVPAAFFLTEAPRGSDLKDSKKSARAKENLQTITEEITTYLSQYFRDKDETAALPDEKPFETNLTERKKRFDQLRAGAEGYKQAGDYDAAIAELGQALEVFPKDIEAYFESGRLYMRKREYGRALARYSQAEELFEKVLVPNQEIGHLRLIQAKEKLEAGTDPNGPDIETLLAEAASNYEETYGKAKEMIKKYPGDPDRARPQEIIAIGREILKWGLADLFGPKHPAVMALHNLANKCIAELDKVPFEELSTNQCLALGLQAVENRDIELAQEYYFYALKDEERFAEICTEIIRMGARVRDMGLGDKAIGIYNRLLEYRPPKQGPVFWNLCLAYAEKQDLLTAAGYAARSLDVDPGLSREKVFYESLGPQLTAILLKLIKTMRLVLLEAKKVKNLSKLSEFYLAKNRLTDLIDGKEHGQALKLFFSLFKKDSSFTYSPGFYGDGAVPGFLKGVRSALAKNPDPQKRAWIRTIDGWLERVAENPVEPRLATFLNLCRAAHTALEKQDDWHQAVFYLGQALSVAPDSYFKRPDFYALETLPAMVLELAGKFKHVNVQRFHRPKKQ